MLRGRDFGVKYLTTVILFALGLGLFGGLVASSKQRSRGGASSQAESAWVTDYKKAQEAAKVSHKLLLLNFTGSDWCGYCFQLDRAILKRPEFKDYASKNLVLEEVDFPRHGGPRWTAQSAEVKKQNEGLAERYQIEGFPTLVVLNGDGKTVWRYDGLYTGGLAAFLAELDKVRKG
jgi:protein disulfide-isomerase